MAKSAGSTAKISVWWDIENCQVPKNVDAHLIAQNLGSALHHANLTGPIIINMFGDTKIFDHSTLEALVSTGISINHIPGGNKDAADKGILVAMLFWALDNPPPAHFLLISGDGDFANALHRLRLKGYDILLARPDKHVKPALLGAATSVWFWTNVAKGEVTKIKDVPEKSIAVDYVNEDSSKISNPKWRSNFVKQSDGQASSEALKRCTDEVMQTCPQPCNTNHTTPQSMQIAQEQCRPHSGQDMLRCNVGYSTKQQMQSAQDQAGPHKEKQMPFASRDRFSSFNRPPLATSLALLTTENHFGLAVDVLETFESSSQKITNTLQTLKSDGLMPTESNLQDCLCYWDKSHKKATLQQMLDQAVYMQRVDRVDMGEGSFTLYLPCEEKLWNCFNTADMQYTFPNALWTELHNFVCASDYQQAFRRCQSMYEVSHMLKNTGLVGIRSFAIGEVIHFLNQAVDRKKWFTLHTSTVCSLAAKIGVSHLRSTSNAISGADSRTMSPPICHSTVKSPTPGKPSTKARILKKLRKWLLDTLRTRSNYDVSLVRKDFEGATGMQLDHKKLGYERFQDLMGEFKDIVTINNARQGLQVLSLVIHQDDSQPRPASDIPCQHVGTASMSTAKDKKLVQEICQEKKSSKVPLQKRATCSHPTLQKMRSWLLQLPISSEGYDISKIRKDFQLASGILLDPKLLGYAKVKDILNEFPNDFRLKSRKTGFMLFHKMKTYEVEEGAKMPEIAGGAFGDSGHELVIACSPSQTRATCSHPTLQKLRSWLLQLPISSEGYNISQITKDFQQASGLLLDAMTLGYGEVKDILNEFPEDFCLESPKTGCFVLFHNTKTLEVEKGAEIAGDISDKLGYETIIGEEGASKFIQKVKLGYETIIGEEGASKFIPKVYSCPMGLKELLPGVCSDAKQVDSICLRNGEADERDFTPPMMATCHVVGNGLEQELAELYFEEIILKKAECESPDSQVMPPQSLQAPAEPIAGCQVDQLPRLDNLQLGGVMKDEGCTLKVAYPPKEKRHSEILQDTKSFLAEMLLKSMEGYPMAKLKTDFKLRFGYKLDQKLAGFSKLQDLLKTLDFVSIEAGPEGAHKMLRLKF